MLRWCVVSAVTALTGCSIFPDLGDLSGGADAGVQDATRNDVGTDSAPLDSSVVDSSSDTSTCSCPTPLSQYRFADPNNLGHDSFGPNEMTVLQGTPKQSAITPNGLPGHSIQLDGASAVCIASGFTFDATSDHTLCWWSQPTALSDGTNQFAQACTYDTWTTNSGADYLWRINNCNMGTAANLQVPNVYTAGKWVQICQTYTKASLKRTVVIDGQQKASVTDTVPILSSGSNWCIGAYGTGGFWTGLIYLPMWFNRVLSDVELQQVHAGVCCAP